MCLYPSFIKNPKYRANQKNDGNIPHMNDPRVGWVPIGCQKCIECKKQKARSWHVRLLEEVKHNTNGKFITLTFSTQQLKKLKDEIDPRLRGYDVDNAIATLAIRRFLERWRKKYGKSLRHWLITELGHGTTEHLHIHGILWIDSHIIRKQKVITSLHEVEQIWQYGYIWKGTHLGNGKIENYVNGRTASYITKYVTKTDIKHPNYNALIFCSPGIGNQYTKTPTAYKNKFKNKDTNDLYRTSTGHMLSLPIYYRNKLYNDQEREQLWLNRLDKEERWICGTKIDLKKQSMTSFYRLLDYHRKRNEELGYGKKETWDKIKYENQRRHLLISQRTAT